jgi:hypothetical protein
VRLFYFRGYGKSLHLEFFAFADWFSRAGGYFLNPGLKSHFKLATVVQYCQNPPKMTKAQTGALLKMSRKSRI